MIVKIFLFPFFCQERACPSVARRSFNGPWTKAEARGESKFLPLPSLSAFGGRGRLGGSGRDSTPTLPSTHQSKARCGTSLKQEEGEHSFSKSKNSVK